MNGPLSTLQTRLEQVARRKRRLELAWTLAACWGIAALVGLIFLIVRRESGWSSSLPLPIVGLIGVVSAGVVFFRQARRHPDHAALAAQIESCYPSLEGRLLTAIQQHPNSAAELSFLQDRLVREALLHGHEHDWAEAVPQNLVALAGGANLLALLLFCSVLWQLRATVGHGIFTRIPEIQITIMPGDTSIERGNSLVVLARFGKTLPSTVDLVLGQTPETSPRIPLTKSLADPMFGGSVPEVTSNFVYHVEYGGEQTRDYVVKVFDYPRLERANVDITPPEYTSQPAKHIENTRRVSAVEGTRLDLELQLNKPVVSAQLVPKEKGTAMPVVVLQVESNHPAASLKNFILTASGAYDLRLLDSEWRTNKAQAQFVFEALKNRTPELRLASPRGDIRPSPLEEISFEGTVWDDFGVRAYGIAFTRPGEETKIIQLGRDVPANEKRPFKHLLRLEDLQVQPDQLLAWFVWADDVAPDGKVRRTSGDMFFAEIRPFEEVFREGESMDGRGQQQGGQNGQSGSQSGRLGELEKQIISATWRLQREHKAPADKPAAAPAKTPPQQNEEQKIPSSSQNKIPLRHFALKPAVFGRADSPALDNTDSNEPAVAQQKRTAKKPALKSSGNYQDDVAVVRDSQSQALDQAEAAAQQRDDARSAALWDAAIKAMEKALSRLNAASNSPAALPEALAAEQAAYEAFLKVQQHEYQVSRSRNRNQNGGGRGQQLQRELEQMDLTKSESRYETQSLAQKQQSAERREQLQVQNRLQELARRQQDLNDRLKELQTALQEAKTEQEREEIRRRLKRLQEEEQQMLADVDELRQRMDSPENQSRMAEERKQLDETREDVQRAADAASQGSPSQALASGTRAQRQLQQLRDQVRKDNSSQFADDVREMRAEARELANQQHDILKKMQSDDRAERKSLSESPAKAEALDQLEKQKARMTNLVDRASQISQQAEEPEPLLSRQLYDTVRKFSQDTAKDFQEAQDDLLQRGMMPRNLYDRLKEESAQPGPGLLDMASELLRQDFSSQASDAGQRAGKSIENLKKGVERAAQSVLGDDTEALRLAQQELDKITDELEREMARGNGGQETNQSAANASRSGKSEKPERASSQQAQTNSGTNSEAQRPGQPSSAGGNQNSNDLAQATQPGSKEQPDGQSRNRNRSSENANPQEQGNKDANGRPAENASSADTNDTAANAGAATDGTGAGIAQNFEDILSRQAPYDRAPLTGADFGPWSDRLRDVEEMIEYPDLRNRVAQARERARLIRQEYKRDLKKPDWAVVRLQVMKPLAEVRDRITDELARRQSADALVPVDRDPVPNRYSDLVRRYYEGLGKAQ